MQRKLTNVDLVLELTALNTDHQYDQIIQKAADYQYHDILKPPAITDPKVELCRDLKKFSELKDIRQDVLNGEYDEADNQPEPEIKDIAVTTG